MIFWLLVAAFAAFAAVLLIRTAAFKPAEKPAVAKADYPVDEAAATARFQQLIRFPTVSHMDESLEDAEAFSDLQAYLTTAYPLVTAACPREILGRRGMLYRWQGKSSEKPSVLMAHYDVVPVEEGEWQEPPFSGIIKDGELWGRGTLDTKGTMHGILEAAEMLIARGFVPENDIYFAFGGDEEIFGGDAPAIVAELQKRGIQPAFVLDEGGAIVENVFPGVKKPAAVIGIAEKGAVCVDITAKGKGGHASAPPAKQAMARLGRALNRLEKKPMPFTLTKPALEMFDVMGRESTFLFKLIFANLWCFAPVLNLICRLSGGELNALVRTTCALTMAQGSKAYNVLPTQATAGVNLRLICGDTIEDAMSRMEKIIGDDSVTLKYVSGENASRISETGDEAWNRLDAAISAAYPGVIVSPYLMLAGSDSRHYSKFCNHVFRFSGMPLTKEQRGLIHNANERIPVSLIKETITFFAAVLERC